MRRQTMRLCAGSIWGQCCTSSKVRPQPLHTASPWLVEQMAMHGVSGVAWYQASHASMRCSGMVLASAR